MSRNAWREALAECVDSLEELGHDCLFFPMILRLFLDELLGKTLGDIVIPGILGLIPDDAKRLKPWDNGILHE